MLNKLFSLSFIAVDRPTDKGQLSDLNKFQRASWSILVRYIAYNTIFIKYTFFHAIYLFIITLVV